MKAKNVKGVTGFLISSIVIADEFEDVREKINRIAYFLRKLDTLAIQAEPPEERNMYSNMQEICLESMNRTRIMGSGGLYAENLYFYRIIKLDVCDISFGEFDEDDLKKIYNTIQASKLGLKVKRDSVELLNSFMEFLFDSGIIPQPDERIAIAINWRDNIWEVMAWYDGRKFRRRNKNVKGLASRDEKIYLKLATRGWY